MRARHTPSIRPWPGSEVASSTNSRAGQPSDRLPLGSPHHAIPPRCASARAASLLISLRQRAGWNLAEKLSFPRRGPQPPATLQLISTRSLCRRYPAASPRHGLGVCIPVMRRSPTAAAQASELPRPTIGKCDTCETCAAEGANVMPSIAMRKNGPAGDSSRDPGFLLITHRASRAYFAAPLSACSWLPLEASRPLPWRAATQKRLNARCGPGFPSSLVLKSSPHSPARASSRSGPGQFSRHVGDAIKTHHRLP
jgi:hypothetical protein